MGIEPTTSAWKAEVLPLNYTRTLLINFHQHYIRDGREDRIRTCDPMVPNHVLYQAELLPVLIDINMARPRGFEPLTF